MDCYLIESSVKKLKKHPSEADLLIDRISHLPDSILCFILSFLPTIQSIRTTILSRRWRYLWTKVPALRFDIDDASYSYRSSCYCHKPDDFVSFERFVNRVFILHDAPSLDKLCISFNSSCCEFYFHSWVSSAISRNLRHFELVMPSSFQLPKKLFTCETLEFLKLCYSDPHLEIPSGVCLPRLETLILEEIEFVDKESFSNLIDGCPILKALSLQLFIYQNRTTFTLSSPLLRRFVLYYDNSLASFPREFCHSLEINAPSLEYLSISDTISQEFTLNVQKSLLEAYIHVRLNFKYEDYEAYKDYSNSVVKLKIVRGLSHAKSQLLPATP
ncbi:hypothetical protein M9H77_31921 [Catharanthus roseus]|uniref:Uncharacterized protein n=1 Tax=Catharanthus roseus TaxID=4058 RepID=A0ACC0A3I4_CATRO|nr:hypothetical protein M9H77_31921 [Catharanthus roseus]